MALKSSLFSIEELIETIKSTDSWKLSIAQRPFEWEKLRITNLVDSILRGFPIGSILLSGSKDDYYEFGSGKGLRQKVENIEKAEHTHLIDGQQRCAAILATFNGEGFKVSKNNSLEYLWINISRFNFEYKEFDEKRGQKYFFHWSPNKQINGLTDEKRRVEKFPPKSPTNGWILFHDLIEFVKKNENKKEIYEYTKCNDIDEVNEEALDKLFKSIKHSLNTKKIPVHVLKDDEIEDIFQVFIRINTGGLPLGPVDVFFAGVKKYWSDAEEHLKCIVNKESIFIRQDAISLLARCAANSLEDKPFDPVRLKLQYLTYNASNGNYPLINQMQELTPIEKENDFTKAVKWVSGLIRNKFYYAANILHRFNVMSVVAWAYQFQQSQKLPKFDEKEFIKPIVGYLFWTKVFGSRYYGKDRFDRDLFRAAWKSGKNGKKFPYYTSDIQNSCFNYHYVRPSIPLNPIPTTLNLSEHKKGSDEYKDAEKILELTKGHKDIFLSLYQKTQHRYIDLDHLVAYNFAKNRFKEGRKFIWDYIEWTGKLGNFAIIDSRANRVLQDKGPLFKFVKQEDKSIQNYTDKNFIKTDPCLTKNEINQCLLVEYLLKNKRKDEAGAVLRDFVAERTLLIWKRVLRVVGRPPKQFDG